MDPERWRRIEALFQLALPPEERASALDAECGGDTALLEEVARLLADDATPGGPLDELDTLVRLEALPDPWPDPWIDRELGSYSLVERIGLGGMGVVYKAARVDGLFEQDVAVKLIRSGAATEDARRRFDFERRALARLNHPNIARLLDGGTAPDGSPYLVMEYVEGAPVDAYCDQHRLTLRERLLLFAKICRAVHFAHKSLIVHRDLKPGNVLIDARGEPKLLDFGIARLLDADGDGASSEGTRTLARVLTPEYASPEQLAGGEVTTATDVYSLGIVLFGLLTGRKPFPGGSRSPAEWERMIAERAPTRPSTAVARPRSTAEEQGREPADFARACRTTPARLRASLRGDLDRIVLMALRKEPERRYASAMELAGDVERHLDGRPVLAREDSLAYRTSRFLQRNKLGVAAAGAVLGALVLGLVAALRGERLAQEQAEHARIEAESFQTISSFLMETFLTSADYDAGERKEEARESIARHAERVRRQYADALHIRANLLDALGRVAAQLELFDDAEELMREALALREGEFGAESLEVALSLRSLGTLDFTRGRFGAAETSLRRALELHRICPPGTHTDVAALANDLAAVLRNVGRHAESERLHEEALALRRAGGADTLPVAESLNNLAGLHLDRGEQAEAKALLVEALEIRERILGADDPLVAQSLSNLATAAFGLGELDEARALLERSEQGFRAARIGGRVGLARVLTNLAAMDLGSGELDAAEARLAEARELQIASLGPDNPAVASTRSTLARVQHARGRDDEARASWAEVLRIRRAAFEPTSNTMARTLQEYGVFLHDVGDLAPAEEAFREAVAILRATPDEYAALLGRAELCLGRCLLDRGELTEAEEVLRAGDRRLQAAAGASAAELQRSKEHLEALAQARAAGG